MGPGWGRVPTIASRSPSSTRRCARHREASTETRVHERHGTRARPAQGRRGADRDGSTGRPKSSTTLRATVSGSRPTSPREVCGSEGRKRRAPFLRTSRTCLKNKISETAILIHMDTTLLLEKITKSFLNDRKL